MTATPDAAQPDDRAVVFTRVFDAPPDLVFRAWVDPMLMQEWWGPQGFSNPVCELDARPGGTWRIHMRGPDGTVYPIKGVYREITRPERLVSTTLADESSESSVWGESGPPPASLMTVTFDGQDGKTNLTIHSLFDSRADRDAVLKMGAEEGWAQSLDRLATLLAEFLSVPVPNETDGATRPTSRAFK